MQKVMGYAEQGNTTVTMSTDGDTSTTDFQGSFPGCTVTVYDVGTTDLATIYSDDDRTAKANPFTASTDGSWFFYAADGKYDVRFSGTGVDTPFTIGAWLADDSSLNIVVNVKTYGTTGDGTTNDTANIQAALTGGAGKTVYFPPGDYKISAQLTVSANTTIMFAQDAWLKPTDDLADTSFFLLSSVDNVRFVNPQIDGVSVTTATTNSYAIALSGSDHFEVDGGYFKDLPTSAIGAVLSDNLYVHGCYFETMGAASLIEGGTHTGSAFIGTGVTNVRFTENLIDYCYGYFFLASPTAGGVISSDIVVDGIIARQAFENGVRVDSDTAAFSKNVTFSNLILEDVDGDAIRASCYYLTISNVVISSKSMVPARTPSGITINEGSHIQIENVIVNDYADVIAYGLHISTTDDFDITDVSVRGVEVTGCDYGVFADWTDDETLNNIKLSHVDSYSASFAGFSIAHVGNLQITDCHIEEAARTGVLLSSVTDFHVSGTTIKNSQNSAGTVGGLALASCDNGIIIANKFYDDQGTETQQYGINFVSDNTDIDVVNNYFDGNTLGAIRNAVQADLVAGNKGYVTKNAGTGTITSGSNNVEVTHGLAVTPTAQDITIIGKENTTNDIGNIWVQTIGATSFFVFVRNDPGGTNWDFGWKVDTEY